MTTTPPVLSQLVDESAVIYSLPSLYLRLNEVINQPDSSIEDVARLITEDAGLTTRLLRLANSPMFGYHASIDSITRAITIIGTQQLRDLTLAISVTDTFNGIPSTILNMQDFWTHSITCGITSRVLATYCREANVERFFVAGMLHDLGQLILCTQFPEKVTEMIGLSNNSGQPHYVIQRQVLGFDHGQIGGALLKRWQLPQNIVEPVSCHHQPDLNGQYPVGTAIVHVADIIAHALFIGAGGEPFIPALDTASWDYLGLPASILSPVLKEVDEQLQDVLSILS